MNAPKPLIKLWRCMTCKVLIPPKRLDCFKCAMAYWLKKDIWPWTEK